MEDACSVEYDAPNSNSIALSFLFQTNDRQITCRDGEVPAKPASTVRRSLQELQIRVSAASLQISLSPFALSKISPSRFCGTSFGMFGIDDDVQCQHNCGPSRRCCLRSGSDARLLLRDLAQFHSVTSPTPPRFCRGMSV